MKSEILVRNFHKLKTKYDLKLCQSRLHTASKTFVSHKTKIRNRFDFLHFHKHFDEKNNKKTTRMEKHIQNVRLSVQGH